MTLPPVRGPYLSVIVPAHDSARTLATCLDAIVRSDLPRDCWELIVVDDASADDSALIAAEYAAEILWRDSTRAQEAADLLQLSAFELQRLGIADEVVAEPLNAASLASVVAYHLQSLTSERAPGSDLLTTRLKRWRRSAE